MRLDAAIIARTILTGTTDSLTEATGFSVREVATRFILPFFFTNRDLQAADDVLRAARLTGAEAWSLGEPHDYYTDELLPYVMGYLFPDLSGRRATLANPTGETRQLYARLQGAVADKLFKDATVEIKKQPYRVRLCTQPGIELFLSSQGFGLLSISIALEGESLEPLVAREFNYRLAQGDLTRVVAFEPGMRSNAPRRKGTCIRLAHPADNAEQFQRIPEDKRKLIAPAPADDAPIDERLGCRGGCFFLDELAERLLAPIGGKLQVQVHQPQFSVYTVVRCDESVDLGDTAICERVGPFLAALTQVEEGLHAGAPADDLGVGNVILNRRHWCGVSSYGTTHIVADQPFHENGGPVEFNHERVTRIFHKYFVASILTLQQRQLIHRVRSDAARLVHLSSAAATPELGRLREELLSFAARGQFGQISYRHAVDRCYGLARQELHIVEEFNDVHRTIGELDAKYAAERQEVLNAQVAKNLDVVTHVQEIVELLEIFIIGVYFAHLWHMIAHSGHSEGPTLYEDWRGWIAHLPQNIAWDIVIWAAFGLVFAWLFMNIYKRRAARKRHH
jgi:hypothetical protein